VPLLFLKRWKEGAIGGLLLAALFLLVQWKKADAELKKARLAYENPAIKEVVRVVRIAGPVRTITRIVERTTGDRETVIEETRSAVSETNDVATESTPIPVATILAEHRSDRYLLTFGVNRLSLDSEGKAIMVGYGFKNRLDIQAGVIHRGETGQWLLATLRF
jgi:hypothetical protein